MGLIDCPQWAHDLASTDWDNTCVKARIEAQRLLADIKRFEAEKWQRHKKDDEVDLRSKYEYLE